MLAFTASGLCLGLVTQIAMRFDTSRADMQFVEMWAWIPSIRVDYHLGIDGLGLLMIGLTALVVPFGMAVCAAEQRRTPLMFALILWLQAGLFGAFTALNFFHWFLFWELSLVPAYFLIKFWGGEGRGPASMQFFVYAMVGSVSMLLAFLALYLASGTFNFLEWAEKGRSGELASALSVRLAWFDTFKTQESLVQCIFWMAFLGFAVKVPMFPFHSWLPSAYGESPTGVTMILTGAMSKLGVYGMLRLILPIFPEQLRASLDLLLWLAVATIVVSAFAALGQKDLKRTLAYSSVNHLGYCLLGLFAAMKVTGMEASWGVQKSAALNGVLLQMFNHGVTAAALFCFLSFLERRSGGLRGLTDFGGLRTAAPVYCGLMGLSMFASLGLPGLSGFAGEFLIFKGAFALAWAPTAAATAGLLVTAIFLLGVMQKVFWGPIPERWAGWTDLTASERLLVIPATLLIVGLGIWPQAVVQWTHATVAQWVGWLRI
jgi:NADH-quinone oxidoreductase subunit M